MAAEVNYIKHLNAVYTRMAEDQRLSPHHISLYLALFQMWNLNHFRSPVSVSRSELKLLSKIGSNNTYSKCLRNLDEFGYIRYSPSTNPMLGSTVSCIRFDTAASIANDTPDEQVKIPKKGASYKPKETGKTKKPSKQIPPEFSDVEKYFNENSGFNASAGIDCNREAQKFFNHFTSNGWKVGGKSPMKDWYAAARNWILNASNFSNSGKSLQPKQLQTFENKNYHEPL
ncbi:MAG TPA: transcriptional regulator [Cryomorphaceae bacterium]|nr:transcriptional regulator [Owenweeksia sp.]MBF98256.1 transcriptional regulator [Owenweeksia sp.]HAD97729.1 transcriptional regulator [Cryomorphaceae bacterium]HBF20064.1 transcriptional regulator [Cryomorphaceae bacterium]|tara:strand:+ start:92 stop:778 length:687 start_codon:yes stop_codon:yes gene_type:complete